MNVLYTEYESSTLTPLGDARPELMVPRALDMQTGRLCRLVFFESEGRILSGMTRDVDGVELQVHSTVQANKKEHRFVPMYATARGKKRPEGKAFKQGKTCEAVCSTVSGVSHCAN